MASARCAPARLWRGGGRRIVTARRHIDHSASEGVVPVGRRSLRLVSCGPRPPGQHRSRHFPGATRGGRRAADDFVWKGAPALEPIKPISGWRRCWECPHVRSEASRVDPGGEGRLLGFGSRLDPAEAAASLQLIRVPAGLRRIPHARCDAALPCTDMLWFAQGGRGRSTAGRRGSRPSAAPQGSRTAQ